MKPHPSHYSGAILQKSVVFLKGNSFSPLAGMWKRKKNVFAAWEDSFKFGGSCNVQEWAVASSLSSVLHRLLPSA